MVPLLAAELAAGLLAGSELGGVFCANATPVLRAVLSTIISVRRILFPLFFFVRWGNRCNISMFHLVALIAGSYASPWRKNTIDNEPWTVMVRDLTAALRDLTAALKHGSTIEDAATHLCRSGTADDVRRKAEKLGLIKPNGVQCPTVDCGFFYHVQNVDSPRPAVRSILGQSPAAAL